MTIGPGGKQRDQTRADATTGRQSPPWYNQVGWRCPWPPRFGLRSLPHFKWWKLFVVLFLSSRYDEIVLARREPAETVCNRQEYTGRE